MSIARLKVPGTRTRY